MEQVAKLNEEQFRAFIDIVTWARQPFGSAMGHILVGFAGTGKTFLIRLLSSVLNRAVLCAPTNKAVKELTKLGTELDCCTIYSLLGLKMEQHEDTIRLTKADSNKVYKYRYVILDECGMVNEELYEYIESGMRSGVKFLFVGDPKQLPPVGEDKSPVWGKFRTSKLFKVMRHDNQILELATHIRKVRNVSDIEIKSNHSKTEGVWYLNPVAFEDRIRKYASKGAFEENTKAIAWRNRTVDSLNHIVRQVIYGDAVYDSKYLAKDKVVFTGPYAIDKTVSIFTDDEATVKDVVVSKHTDYDLMCYYLTIDLDSRELMVKTIHESEEKKLDSMLNDLANEARKPGNGKLWHEFWKLRNSLCNLKYAHALTAHRSQGSTYQNVFVDSSDILKNSNRKEAKKCLYVAATRPSTKLFIM